MRVLMLMLVLLASCGGVTVREVPPNDPPQQQQAQVDPQQQQAQQPVCPQGSTWNGSACVGTVDTSCPAGTAFVENRGCVAVRAGAQMTQPPPPPPPPPGTTCPPGTAWGGSSCMVTKAAWVERMNAALPGKICALPIFQRCFRATRIECERIVASLSDACMSERSLPPLFDDARGQREGEAVGRCIGEAYAQNMKARNRAVVSAECQ